MTAGSLMVFQRWQWIWLGQHSCLAKSQAVIDFINNLTASFYAIPFFILPLPEKIGFAERWVAIA